MFMGNCSDEKMVVISSTTKEWPQINNQMISPDDPKACLNNNMHQPAPSNARIMEKPGQQIQQQQQQQALKCPRCDSSNTKFCYYNNYNLSQPRHFCKACKRYWTRGGTLRNVPVGGGCRKNKRVKRPNSSSSSSSSPSSSLLLPHHHHHDLHHNNSSNSSSSSSPSPSSLLPSQIDNHHIVSPLFYGLDNNNVPSNNNNNNNNSHDIAMSQLPFARLMSSTTSGYHDLLHSHLGFSSGNINNNTTILSCTNTTTDHYNNNQINGFSDSNSSPLLSSYSSIFSTPSLSSPSPAITSLLASKFTTNGGLKDHVLSRGSSVNFPSLSSPFGELQITGNNGKSGMGLVKQVKLEDGQRRTLDWNGSADNCATHENDDLQTVGEQSHVGLSSPSDPNSLNYWSINPTAVGGANWHDPGSIGSSVPSLI